MEQKFLKVVTPCAIDDMGGAVDNNTSAMLNTSGE
jgi:hypothetical protein